MNILKLLKRIHLYNIFLDIMKCFIASCGVVLLLLFFHDGGDVTKNELEIMVHSIFILLFFLCIPYKVFCDNNWFYDDFENSKVTSISVGGKAEKKELLVEKSEVTSYNRRVIAVHEAGHALMLYLKDLEEFKIVISCMSSCVSTVYKQMNKENIQDYILTLYAGAAAEEIIMGNFHTSCMDDFEKAASFIKLYVTMTDPTLSKTFLDEELASRTIVLSKEFYQLAKDELGKNKKWLNILAEELKDKDRLTRKEIQSLLT